MKLILFTASYPYDIVKEQTYLGAELSPLLNYFDEITIVPRLCVGGKYVVPDGIKIEEGLSKYLLSQKKKYWSAIKNILFSRYFYQELFTRTVLLFSWSALFRLLSFVQQAELIRQWTENWIERNKISSDDSILLYSYWLDETATGVGLLKQRHPNFKVISRAHGYDVYEERRSPPYWPCRRLTLALLDRLFFASENAASYIRERYPEFSAKYQTSHLGVNDPGFMARSSDDNVFRIVSCSSVVPVKRLNLLAEGVLRVAELRPDQKMMWSHFGDGVDMPVITDLVQTLKRPNLNWYFPGYVPNELVMKHYKTNPVDLFVNVSKSEGGAPVAIQEAISCGIPVLATSVGGNPEIVLESNGSLLSADPTSSEIAAELLKLMDDPALLQKKRLASRGVWEDGFNAAINFRLFVLELKKIMESR